MKVLVKSRKHGIFEVLIDDEDFDLFNKYAWYIKVCSHTNYLVRSMTGKDHSKREYFHRKIMNPGKNHIDHIDSNGLNNRKSNLRPCSRSKNMQNSKKPKNNKSGYKGVHWCKEHKSWRAKIMVDGKAIYIGSFKNKEDAALAYDVAAKKYHGEFANLNFSS
jgi:hypothetical protein